MALQLAGATATAGVLVYLNELADGSAIPTPFEPIAISTNSTPTLELYIVKDDDVTSSGVICVDAGNTGGETCGFELEMLADVGLMFENFVDASLPNDQINSKKLLGDVPVTSGDFDKLRVNGTNTRGPWSPVPMHIGSLTVRSDATVQGRVSVASGLHVDAAGNAATVPAMPILTVPEPSQLAMLLAGLALLGLLHPLRRRGASARKCP